MGSTTTGRGKNDVQGIHPFPLFLHVRFAIGEQWWRNRVILEDAYEMKPSFTSPSHSSSKKSPEDSFLSISILWIPSEVLPRKWAL